MIRVAIESTVQEFRIADNCLKQFFRITGVGQITSAFSCNLDLFAHFFIFFKLFFNPILHCKSKSMRFIFLVLCTTPKGRVPT